MSSHDAKQGQSPEAVTHQVAVLAVIFAGVITVITANPDLLYTPGDIVLGLAFLLILHAYDVKEGNKRLQTTAFAAAWAFSFLILVGYAINLFWVWTERVFEDNQTAKIVGDAQWAVAWFIVFVTMYVYRRYRIERPEAPIRPRWGSLWAQLKEEERYVKNYLRQVIS